MSAENQAETPDVKSQYTSILRVTHIPLVESGISTIHDTLSKTPLIRTPYHISLAISSTLVPYLQSASTHYPFAPFLAYGDRAANKTLDIAQEKWPYPFESKPEQVWGDVRSVADSRVIQPAVSVAKTVDQSLAPIVDTFSSVVNKFHTGIDDPVATEDSQIRRAYGLLQKVKVDIVRYSNEEQTAIVQNINDTLTRLSSHSSALLAALRSRSEDAAARAHDLGQSVLVEVERLPPLLASLSSNASTTIKDATASLRDILTSPESFSEKIPKVRMALKDILEDITGKVHTSSLFWTRVQLTRSCPD
ncbi:hypothetical protein BU17DRAFT_42993 [Hysterangium stoloniferum]|nr:hypothetical protein BU17DRAFT_42993 [Hysterangium stoloniferum]